MVRAFASITSHISHNMFLGRRCYHQKTLSFTRTPCKLAYIKPCKCWQLQPYVHLDPLRARNRYPQGSLDSIVEDPDGPSFAHYPLDIGEVAVAHDGLLHPHSACKWEPSRAHVIPLLISLHSPSAGPRDAGFALHALRRRLSRPA